MRIIEQYPFRQDQ